MNMKMIWKAFAGLFGLIVVMSGCSLLSSTQFQAQENGAPDCKTAVFDKSAKVFDAVLICGTDEVSVDKLQHAANVTAEWLDNDGDGLADEPRLIETLQSNNPVLIMTKDGISPIRMPRIESAFSNHRLQDLHASETNPGNGQRDASQEEIHHLIMNAGWQSLFPDTFSETPDEQSTLFQTWSLADENRWYVYNDPTCDDSCKVTEFVYLATAAYMEEGAEADLASDEMRLKTRAELSASLPAIIDIFESPDYVYPINHWPTGQYEHSENIVFFNIDLP